MHRDPATYESLNAKDKSDQETVHYHWQGCCRCRCGSHGVRHNVVVVENGDRHGEERAEGEGGEASERLEGSAS